MLLWEKKLEIKDDKVQGRWFHGCDEISVLCMTSKKNSLQESAQYFLVGLGL